MTSPMPEPGRRAAHVLLDALTGYENGKDPASADLATQGLQATGAVEAEVEADGAVVVDVRQLVGGTVVMLHWLVARLAHERGQAEEQVVQDLRAFLDG